MTHRYHARVFVCSLLIGLMLLGPMPVSMAAQAARAAEGGGEGRLAQATPTLEQARAHVAEGRTRIQRRLRALMATYRAQKPVTLAPGAVVAEVGEVGGEPAALHRYVHEQTHLVPYHGSLRGPAGVLVDGTGNSLDRARLLARMLEEAGHDARLARGRLGEAEAETLWEQVRQRQQDTGLPVSDPLSMDRLDPATREEVDARVARALEMTPEALAERRAEARSSRQRHYEDALNTVSRQAAALREMVEPHREHTATTTDDARRDHWWIEWRGEATGGEWAALDPSRAPQNADEPRTEAQSHHALNEPLPSELLHEVSIEVVAEQWSVDGLSEEVALRGRFEPGELITEHVRFMCAPMRFSLPDEDVEDPLAALKERLVGEDEWMPVLTVGDATTTQSSIRTDGSINENPAETPTAQAVDEATGALQALRRGGDDDEAESQLSAVHLDFILHVPGAEGRREVRHRRTVMDVLGEARRRGAAEQSPGEPAVSEATALERALGLLGQTQTLILPGRMPTALADRIGLVSQIHDSHRMAQTLAALERDRDHDVAEALSEREPIPGPLYTWAALRDAWSVHRGAWFVDEPVVVNMHSEVAFDADDLLATRLGTDVVNNPATPGPAFADEPFTLRLSQGVLDTALEGVALHREEVSLRRNTAALWETARANDVPWSLDAVSETWPGDARARMADQRERALVVAPQEPVRVGETDELGWWHIDPATGRTLGYGARGWGQDLTEYQATMQYGTAGQKALYWAKGLAARGAAAGHGAAAKYTAWLMAMCVLCTGVTVTVVGSETAGIACDFYCQAFGPG